MRLKDEARLIRHHARIVRILLKHGREPIVRAAGLERLFESGVADDEGDGHPEELAHDLEELGPTFVKLGQLLSTRSDLLPKPYIDALARLQDDVDPISTREVRDQLENELGVSANLVFSEIDEKPLAAASLGQVHRAVLRDGRVVAVKVQRPGVEDRVSADLAALGQIASFIDRHSDGDFELRRVVSELGASLKRELDYEREARNLEALGEHLERYDALLVPQPVRGYTTRRVLVMDYVEGTKVSDVGPLRRTEVDGPRLADQLFRAYLKQVLVDGFFHADPHPGNVLLTPDGRLALLDLGMVERLTPRLRDQLTKMLVAIAEADGDDAAEAALEIGEKRDDFRREEAARRIASIVAWQEGATVAQMPVGDLIMDVARVCRDCGVRVPGQLTMLGKTLLSLDRIGRTLAPDFDPNAAIRKEVTGLLGSAARRSFGPGQVLRGLIDVRELVRALPSQVHEILQRLAHDRLRVQVDAIDETRLIRGFQKVANRITVGLVLASMIVGAALLMSVETEWRILGYPALAMLLFLGAVVGGVAVIIDILRSDE